MNPLPYDSPWDSFSYESWDDAGTASAAEADGGQDAGYYTYAGSLEMPLTILGFAAMTLALVAWVVKDRNHLEAAAATLRADMARGGAK